MSESETKEKFLRNAIYNALEEAYKKEDRELLSNVENYLSRLLVLRKLWKAFRASPDHKIDGSGGVAEQLGVSRNGVYCLLQMVRYDPIDFARDVEFWVLIRESQGLNRWAEKVPHILHALGKNRKSKL